MIIHTGCIFLQSVPKTCRCLFSLHLQLKQIAIHTYGESAERARGGWVEAVF